MLSLAAILDALNRRHQRATYGAVAEALGRSPRSLLQGQARDWRHSWVVNQETGLPTEYPAPMVHPAIMERDEILRSGAQLLEWLNR